MNNWLDFIRGFVRPFLAYTGWLAIIVLACVLALRFANADLAMMFVGALIGTVATVVGFYVNDRTNKTKTP